MTTPHSPIIIAALLAATLPMMAADEAVPLVPLATPDTHVVKLGSLEVQWSEELRLEAEQSRPIKVGSEEWGRSAEVLEVLTRSGLVRKGDTLLRLDTTDIDEAIDNAKTALAELKTRQDIDRRTRAIEQESMATDLEQSVKADERARRDLDLFMSTRSKIQQEQQQMSFERSSNYVDDQAEELRQLEEMYGDTTLADRTKDIVLERARRGLDLAQRSFEHTQTNNGLWKQYSFPDQKQDMQDNVRWKTQRLDHTRIRQQLTEMRWELDTARAARELKDAQEKVDNLLKDREQFVIKAPIDGVLTRIGVEVGDDVGMQQTLAQVHDVDSAHLKGTINAEALAVVQNGMRVDVDVDAFPGLTLPGTITHLGLIGSPSGNGTTFPIEIDLRKSDERLRLGLACTAHATRNIEHVIAIPRAALHRDGDRTYTRLQRGEVVIKQDVVTGRGNSDEVEIVSGLKIGDQILLDDESDE